MKPAAPVRTSALYRIQQGLGATFGADGDWRVVDFYTSAADERQRALVGGGIADVSAGGKFTVRGETLDPLAAKLGGTPPAVGWAARARWNGVEVYALRLAADELLVLTDAAGAEATAALLATAADSVGCAHVSDVTSALVVLDLIGPTVPSVLVRLSPIDLGGLRPLAIVPGELARVRAIILRLDLVARPAFRVLVPRELGQFVWTELIDAGRDAGLVPVGAAARARLVED